MGDGSSPLSLSHAGIGRLLLAASFPTLFSTASGVIGLVAGPSSAFAVTEFRVRLFSLLRLVFATPAGKPGRDTSVTFTPRLDHLAPGQPPQVTVR